MTQTFSKLLGYCMVAGGAIVKVPQLIKILVDKSVYGISYPSLILELATNWITIVYNWYRGNSFSIYGENVFIGAQNLLIMAFFVLFIRNVPLSIPKPPEGAYIKYMTLFLLACLTMFFTQNPSAWPPILIQSSMILQIFLCTQYFIQSLLPGWPRSYTSTGASRPAAWPLSAAAWWCWATSDACSLCWWKLGMTTYLCFP